MTKAYAYVALGAAAILAACANPFAASADAPCTRELGVRFTPGDTTIAVGQAFTAAVHLSSCGGREQLSDVVTWSAQDTTVVSVDPTAGLVTGRALGETRLQATGATYGLVGGPRVVVR